ncbi:MULTISPECIES: tripartite tricarboxylate transporter permease [unclassified Chelatococcus]|uniref:tripartite tricarboxylate transporter permease n=1 Tax=unclassified Chelatococcus TaxID=2638111 RepID=UPI001BCF42BF|nr:MULTISPECIES: tripartite tricarboxylate transporter permease [unclassified Chelatococcus]MBS7701035.1 tripartite tricarboxylate transporter permease [Chelatococcus sp. YT9]MBX3555568.1 tripartite tricarboxylate transporter permease [Chelatococcus sp.]
MDLFGNLLIGFGTALSLQNLVYAFAGCLLGTLIGVLPGLGPLATISMLLPFTFGLDPTAALIMLAGIYYGAAYGGSTTAILVNLPGETSSVVTVLDGYQMARQGRAGVAIATAAIGSFFAGCVGTLVLAAFAAPLANVAFRFGGAEYFSLMVVGLIGAVSLASGSVLKAIGMILIGVILGTVGTDLNSGVQRFTFGTPNLWEGIDFIVIAVGLFAFGEVIASLENDASRETFTDNMGRLMPNGADFRRMTPAILRGTSIGTLLGILPGAGLSLSSFFSYSLEKKVSRFRHELGKGAIEGVAGPESANNAAAQTAFIPTLTLGIPGSPTMALMLGAMVMHNIQPGPQVMTSNPDLFWGLIVSMWIGNLILIILNLPLVGLWVRLLRIPYGVLYPAILLFCCLGVYSVQFSTFDLFLAAGFGLAGYAFRKLECEPAPLVLGFVLGPLLEENFRRAMVLSQGDFTIFVREPISLCFLLLAVALLVAATLPKMRRERDAILREEM